VSSSAIVGCKRTSSAERRDNVRGKEAGHAWVNRLNLGDPVPLFDTASRGAYPSGTAGITLINCAREVTPSLGKIRYR
jgi:hypothetical protein